ncbi:hypothetical protein AUP68_13183 [Ilyonectria robusta]
MPATGPDAGALGSPTETSPLLGDRLGQNAANQDAENGHEDENGSELRAVAKKMHVIFPAVGLGICTDQELVKGAILG